MAHENEPDQIRPRLSLTTFALAAATLMAITAWLVITIYDHRIEAIALTSTVRTLAQFGCMLACTSFTRDQIQRLAAGRCERCEEREGEERYSAGYVDGLAQLAEQQHAGHSSRRMVAVPRVVD